MARDDLRPASPATPADEPPVFDAAFRRSLAELFHWRRDVRHFRPDPLPAGLLDELLAQASLAPSVGFSQPARLVLVESGRARAGVLATFEACNEQALQGYGGERAALYARLKLSGLREAPVHLAVFSEEEPEAGHGLGRRTMPETLRYSVVTLVHTFWLAARAHGVGVGWVSILDPAAVHGILAVPASWTLVAYLCIGYPDGQDDEPLLQREGWQQRTEPPVLRR